MFEMLVGLDVADDDGYRAYREAMLPLLESVGGGFRYDFTIDRTLKSPAGHPINRVFTICFPDRDTRDRFFDDPTYRAVRARLFESAVRGTTIIAEYEVLTDPAV